MAETPDSSSPTLPQYSRERMGHFCGERHHTGLVPNAHVIGTKMQTKSTNMSKPPGINSFESFLTFRAFLVNSGQLMTFSVCITAGNITDN